MRNCNNTGLARSPLAGRHATSRAERTCAICLAAARLFAGAAVALAIAYAPSLLGTLTAWCIG